VNARHVALALCALSGLCTLAPSTASAQSPLRGHSHRGWLAFGLGPTINLNNELGLEAGFAALSLQQQLGVRLGTGPVGASVALDLRESWASGRTLGGFVTWNGFVFEAGPRAWLDIELGPRGAFSLSPNLGLNFLMLQRTGAAFGFSGGRTDYGIAPQVAVDLKLVLLDRVLIYLRPFGLDLNVVFERNSGSSSTTSRFVMGYDLQLGVGVTL
jgi:hypothetical protein